MALAWSPKLEAMASRDALRRDGVPRSGFSRSRTVSLPDACSVEMRPKFKNLLELVSYLLERHLFVSHRTVLNVAGDHLPVCPVCACPGSPRCLYRKREGASEVLATAPIGAIRTGHNTGNQEAILTKLPGTFTALHPLASWRAPRSAAPPSQRV